MRACPLGDVKTWWVNKKDDISLLLLSFLGFQMLFQVHLKVCLYLLALSWRLRLLPFPSDEIKRENSSRSVIISFHLIAFVHPSNILARPFTTEPKHSITWQKKQRNSEQNEERLSDALNSRKFDKWKKEHNEKSPESVFDIYKIFYSAMFVESSQPDADPLSVSLYSSSSVLCTYHAVRVDWVSLGNEREKKEVWKICSLWLRLILIDQNCALMLLLAMNSALQCYVVFSFLFSWLEISLRTA